MTKRVIYIFFSLLILAGCNIKDPFSKEGDCQSVTLNFGFNKPAAPEITVKSPEPPQYVEEAISDLYIIVFDSEGNRRGSLSRFYNKSELGLEFPFTEGTLNNITLPTGSNVIYLIANINGSHNMNITKEMLDAISTESQLKALEVEFINVYQAPSNTGIRNNILMWGRANVFVACGMEPNVNITLRNIESKVRFRVFLHPDVIGKLSVDLISYSVENVPRRGLVVADRPLVFSYENRQNDVYAIPSAEFDSPEDPTITRIPPGSTQPAQLIGDFYYYQMENCQVPTKEITASGAEAFKLRTKLLKDENGMNIGEMFSDKPSFEYAPQMCTFVRIRAQLSSSDPTNLYHANVYYYFPLGHDPNDPNDYRVLANYTYTYNVYIKGVKDVVIEADVQGANTDLYDDPTLAGKEVNSLTEGIVSYSPNEVFVDSHYANVEMSIHKRHIKEIKNSNCSVSFIASTPFDKPSLPTLGKKDIKWISFTPIPKTSNLLVPYPGDQATKDSPTPRIMVDELNDMIKNGALDNYIRADSSIKFTVYVDEFFYDRHPINSSIPIRFADFVNLPPRSMFVYFQNFISKDKQSQLYRDAFVVYQKSIWTIYSQHTIARIDGYGIEAIEETSPVATPRVSYSGVTYNDVRKMNGLHNVYNIWAKTTGSSTWRITFNADGSGNSLWKFKTVQTRSNTGNVMSPISGDPTYANQGAAENDWANFNSKLYNTGAFACLQRNRDNNGNGIIDKDEIKWYLPSFYQMLNTYIGRATIPDIYWFHHLRDRSNLPTRFDESHMQVTTPKRNTNGYIGCYWSDEGVALGHANSPKRVRCFRNLPGTIVAGAPNNDITESAGDDFGKMAFLTKATASSPAYVRITRNLDPSTYRSRFVESGPLPAPHVMREAANTLTYYFYVAEKNLNTGGALSTIFANTYAKGKDPCDSYVEKGITGWRTPNQVELVLIYLIDRGEMGPATDGTSTIDYFTIPGGLLNNLFPVTFAYDKFRNGAPVTTFRVHTIENNASIIEKNWNEVQNTRCVKDMPIPATP